MKWITWERIIHPAPEQGFNGEAERVLESAWSELQIKRELGGVKKESVETTFIVTDSTQIEY